MSIKFSILIPAYKRQFLSEAIDSVISQTYNNWELIIVDDHSPENIYSIVSRYDDSRIRYERNEKNFGAIDVVDNWNKCLEYATGDYVICMGDDDKLASNALDEYVQLIIKYPALNAFHARVIIIDEKGERIEIVNDRSEYEPLVSFIRHRLEGRKQYIGDFCFSVKRLREIGGYYKLPLAWGSDDITAYLCACPSGIANTYFPTFYYRTNNQTISNNGYTEVKLEAREEMWNWLDGFLNNIKAGNDIERLILNQLHNNLRRYRSNSFMCDIYEDLKKSRWRIIYWFLKKKRYRLTNVTLMKALAKTYIS